MFEVVIVCGTVLIVFAGVLWFCNKFLTSAKVREAELAQQIHAKVDEKLASVETKVASVHAELKKDINGLFQNQTNITSAINMAGKVGAPGSIGRIFENLQTQKKS